MLGVGAVAARTLPLVEVPGGRVKRMLVVGAGPPEATVLVPGAGAGAGATCSCWGSVGRMYCTWVIPPALLRAPGCRIPKGTGPLGPLDAVAPEPALAPLPGAPWAMNWTAGGAGVP